MASRDPTGPAAPEAPGRRIQDGLPFTGHMCHVSLWDLLTLLAKEALGRLGGPDIVAGGAREVIGCGAGVPGCQRLRAQTRGPLGVVQAPHRLLVTHALHRDVGLDDAGNRRAVLAAGP